MKRILIIVIVIISFLLGFLMAIQAFRTGWNSLSYYHLEWDYSFDYCQPKEELESCVKDCLYYVRPIGEKSARIGKIICITPR